jgi:uncharacterized membrane protein
VGDTAKVIVGVANQEQKTMTYKVEIKSDGVASSDTGSFVLKQGQKWENPVDLIFTRTGGDQAVTFYLYKNGVVDATQQPLQLLINVTQ